jgi:hypothetical protein
MRWAGKKNLEPPASGTHARYQRVGTLYKHEAEVVNLRKSAKIPILRRMALCIVSYVDTEGLRHTVEVEAESLYEAAALAVRTFKQHDCEPLGANAA